MKTLLQINSGMQGTNSQSSILADKMSDILLAQNENMKHIKRDLNDLVIPQLNCATVAIFFDEKSAVTLEQKTALALSNTLIAELKEADIIVFGTGMYNQMIPSSFKSWIDHIVRVGETFQFSKTGPVGLLKSKKAYLIIAQGGLSLGTPADLMSEYLTKILAYIGVSDIDFIYARGLARGEQSVEANLTAANREIAALCHENDKKQKR
jgi:FMN-dependent NADH-azoreductase